MSHQTSKNNCYVVTKAPHGCKYCDKMIHARSKVRTINTPGQGRFWICNDCETAINNILQTKAEIDNLPFDDEGGNLALYDFLSEQISELEQRCPNSDIADKINHIVLPHNLPNYD